MHTSYAVSWQEPSGFVGSGRLELGTDALILDGRNGSSDVRRAFPYRNMSGFRIARGSGERLRGRPTLMVDLESGGSLRIASVAQPGIVAELAERLGTLAGPHRVLETEALVVPLRPGAQAKAEALLAQGPPFDPAEFGLVGHQVFVTNSEVVFIFEGAPGAFTEHLSDAQTVWKAAEAWRPLINGPIRMGLRRYAWRAS